MDEPTATLTAHEFHLLVRTIGRLKASGVGLIFITHHLEEIFEICDDVTVMRDGRSVESRPVSGWTEQSMIQAMVNRPIDKLFPKRDITLGAVRLSVRDLASPGRFSGVSFQVRAGEVYGLAGLVGAGRTEILKAIFGAVPVSQGEITLEGGPYRPHSPRDALSRGIALVPEDRKPEGLLLSFPIRQNIALSTLRTLSRFGFILRPRAIQLQAADAIRSLRIKAVSAGQEVRRLSGGNQQKVVLARVISVGPRVFLLDEPTRGIDVGAKIEVYNLIGDLAAKGAAVLVVSSDLLELIGLCDTIGVLRSGRKTGELDRTQFSQDRIMSLATAG
jgi:ABC-type sugar transport system ATPase subunit